MLEATNQRYIQDDQSLGDYTKRINTNLKGELRAGAARPAEYHPQFYLRMRSFSHLARPFVGARYQDFVCW
jgi:hypothetical protein